MFSAVKMSLNRKSFPRPYNNLLHLEVRAAVNVANLSPRAVGGRMLAKMMKITLFKLIDDFLNILHFIFVSD